MSDEVTVCGVLVEPALTAEVTAPRSRIDSFARSALYDDLTAQLKRDFDIPEQYGNYRLLDNTSFWAGEHQCSSLSPTR